MGKDFKPSSQSLTPQQRVLASLRYTHNAARALEDLAAEEELPSWVQLKIRDAAMNMGMAIQYIRQQKKSPQEESE